MKTEFKASMKMFAFLMAVIMLIASLPVYAFAGLVEKEEEQANELTETAADVIVLEEDKTLRDESIKHFKLSDGTTKAVIYSQPVHYKSEDGKWLDIDNSLTLNGNEYSSKNKQEIKFANKSGSNGLVSIKDGEYKIDFTPLDTSKVRVEIENPQENNSRKFEDVSKLNNLVAKAIYKNIYNGIDIEYILVGNNIKENIIVKEKQDSYTFSFELKLNKLSAELKDGAIVLSDCDSGEPVYKIPAPYMYDANGVYSEAVEYTLEQNSKWNYTFTVTADTEWINADDRAFPVIVDPAINVNKASIVEDTSIESMFPDDCAGSYTLVCAGGSMTTYWKTNQLPNIPQNVQILDASFNLTYHSSNRLAITYLSLYEVISDWDEETFNYSEYISGRQGQRASSMIGYTDTSEIYKEVYTWDVTELVDKWYQNPNVNFGLAIGEENPTLDENKYRFYSSEGGDSTTRPTLTITYLQTKGIEAYWSYASQNAGLAGTGSVSLSAGNLVFSKGTLTTTENIFGFSPTLTYDSNMAGKPYDYNYAQIANSIAFTPYGFKLNANETLIKKEAYDGRMCYIWSDSDGTEHNFFPSLYNDEENIWYDDSGLQLRIELDETNDMCYMFDSGNNKRIFENKGISLGAEVLDTYYLSGVVDKNGNELRFYLENNNKPVTISLLPNGNGASINILQIAYNSSGNIYSVWNKQSGQAVVLRYSDTSTGTLNTTGGVYLRELIYLQCSNSIEQDDLYSFIGDFDNQATGITVAGVAKYEYDNNGYLICAQDTLSKYKIEYTYTNGKVTEIKEYGEDNNQGQTLSISYNIGYTEVRTSGTDDIFNNSDDLINVYVFDDNGRTISAYTTNVERTQVYGAQTGQYENEVENAKNSIKLSAVAGSSSANYLLNGSFENNENYLKYWTAVGNVQGTQGISWSWNKRKATLTAGANEISSIYQDVNLYTGEYCLSVNMSGATDTKSEVTLQISYNNGEETITESKTLSADTEYSYMTFKIDGESGVRYNTRVTISLKGNSTLGSEEVSKSINSVMLSKSTGAQEYNYSINGGFDMQTSEESWSYGSYGDITSSGVEYNALRLEGSISESRTAKQTIFTTPSGVDFVSAEPKYFILSGFGKAQIAINNDDSVFAIKLEITTTSGAVISDYVSFNSQAQDWQYASGIVCIPAGTYVKKLSLVCEYSHNVGEAYFDNIVLEEANETTFAEYAYYNSGKLKGQQSGRSIVLYKYDENGNLTHEITKRGMTQYTYDSCNRVVSATSYDYYKYFTLRANVDSLLTDISAIMQQKQSTEYVYDRYGLLTNTETTVQGSSEKLTSSSTYITLSDSKIFGAMSSSTDTFGNTTSYYYDSNSGRLLATIEADGEGLYYTYDDIGNLIKVQPAVSSGNVAQKLENGVNVQYIYNDKQQLEKIVVDGTEYVFTYDSFGNQSAVAVKGTEDEEEASSLVQIVTNEHNGKVSKEIYADGTEISYEYDTLERISKVTYTKGEASHSYTYTYDSNGRLVAFSDSKNNKSFYYHYDSNGNLEYYSATNNDDMSRDYYFMYEYDRENRMIIAGYYDFFVSSESARERLSATNEYTYSEANGSLTLLSFNYGAQSASTSNLLEIIFTYDSFDRYSSKAVMEDDYKETITYTYVTKENATSPLIDTYRSEITLDGEIVSTSTLKYIYDETYTNIDEIKNVESNSTLYKYTYDYLDRLVCEENYALNKKYVFSYDENGNILSETVYTLNADGTTTGESITNSYTYSSEGWKDQLLEYNGQGITYDEMGNPLSYLGYTFTWENIRNLSTVTGNGQSISYTYDDAGIRTSKTVNGVKHEYVVEGSRILSEAYGNVFILYLYDEAGLPIGMAYRESGYAPNEFDKYYFTKNLQGDILNIYSEAGTKVASYTYDAWGNHTVTNYTSNNIGNINPFRYRSYYYDSETNFYYLNSRYYDPEIKRFINADVYITTGQGLNSFNMYVYCNNNPIMYVDPTGEIAGWVAAIIVMVAVVAVNHLISGIECAVADANVEGTYTIEEAKKAIEEITGTDTVTFGDNNVQINDSYNIHSRYDRIKISKIIQNTVDDKGNKLTDRTTYGLSAEWVGHNLMYNLHIMRNNRTEHVNLDFNFKDNDGLTEFGTVCLMIVGWL